MRASVAAALVASLLSAPLAARAESPRHGSFELAGGPYRPNIDAGYVPGSTSLGPPYAAVFGTGRHWAFRTGASWALFSGFGTLEVGFRTGYFRAGGHALQRIDGVLTPVQSADTTAFNIVPTSATLTYRLDFLADRWNIPLVPYGRVALERYNWWITGASGGTSRNGATNGYSYTGGLAFLLDFLDPPLARELDEDTGINHTYVFADITKTKIDDFGSKKSWDLSDPKLQWGFGLMFVF